MAMQEDRENPPSALQEHPIFDEEAYFYEEEDDGQLSIDFDPTSDIAPSSTYKYQKPPTTASELDEGWRWRKDLILKYEDFTYDFNPDHQKMAIKESYISSQLTGDTNKANIAIAQFSFLIENFNGLKEIVHVPLYVNEGRESPVEIIFRSGRAAKDKPLFKSGNEAKIHDEFYIHPPVDSKITDNELPFEANISKIKSIESALTENKVEQAKELLKDIRVNLEERLSKKQKNDEHMERLQNEIKERFNVESSSPPAASIIGRQIYKRIKDSPWDNPNRMQELYLHSEQNMLLYFKDHIVKVIESNFRKVHEAVIPSLVALKTDDPQQPKIGKIHGIILNLHSRLDICDRCAPSIARECERPDSFVATLKKWVPEYLNSENIKFNELGLGEKEYQPEAPFFAVFSSVRQELSNQDRRFKCGHDNRYQEHINVKNLAPYFITKIVEPFKYEEVLCLGDIG